MCACAVAARELRRTRVETAEMGARFLAVAGALLALLIGTGSLFAAEPTAAGLWQTTDQDTGQPTGWFLIREHDGIYDGMIVKMFLKPGQDPNVVCDQCTDDRHDKPWLGLDLIRGMKRQGLTYSDGTILDPRSGRIYNAMMTLSPDGQTLTVRGYFAVPLLGENQYWTRLPDSAYNDLDPRFNPNHAAPARKTRAAPAAPARPTQENAARR
jgi:hypothetical protein